MRLAPQLVAQDFGWVGLVLHVSDWPAWLRRNSIIASRLWYMISNLIVNMILHCNHLTRTKFDWIRRTLWWGQAKPTQEIMCFIAAGFSPPIYHLCGVGSPWFIVFVGSVHHDLSFLWDRPTVVFVISVGSIRYGLSPLWGRPTVVCYFCGVGPLWCVGSAHRGLLFMWGRLTVIHHSCGVGPPWFIISVGSAHRGFCYFCGVDSPPFIVSVGSAHRLLCYFCGIGSPWFIISVGSVHRGMLPL